MAPSPRPVTVRRAPTLHIVCPGLRHAAGHERSYTDGLIRSAREAGVPALAYHSTRLGAVFRDASRPVRLPVAEPGRNLLDRARARIARARRALAYAQLFWSSRPEATWLVHTADHDELLLIARAFRRLDAHLALIVRYDHYDDPRIIARLSQLVTLARDRGITLLTDSDDLAEDFRRRWDMKLDVVPPPTSASAAAPRPAGEPVFGYFGAARREKGFALLPAVAQAIRAASPQAKLLVQAYAHPDDAPASELAEARARLRATSHVELIEEFLDDESYVRQLERCHALVLPYDSRTYRRVTSGVFVEALAAGRGVVATPGTWMAAETARFGLERVAIAPTDDAEALAAASAAALGALNRPAPRTDAWASKHGFDALLSGVLEAARSV